MLSIWWIIKVITCFEIILGGIQQLRGQEEGGAAKSPRLSTQGEGGPLNVHVDQKTKLFQKVFHTNVHFNGW